VTVERQDGAGDFGLGTAGLFDGETWAQLRVPTPERLFYSDVLGDGGDMGLAREPG
jgi:hypothetical protein